MLEKKPIKQKKKPFQPTTTTDQEALLLKIKEKELAVQANKEKETQKKFDRKLRQVEKRQVVLERKRLLLLEQSRQVPVKTVDDEGYGTAQNSRSGSGRLPVV